MAAAAAMAGVTRCVRPPALAAFEVAVRGRGAALARLQLVGVHRQAHAAARLAPLEAGGFEDLVQPLGLGLLFHLHRARHDHRVDIAVDLLPSTISAAARRSPMRALVQEPMKTRSSLMSSIGAPASGPCIQRALLAVAGGIGHRGGDGRDLAGLVPQLTFGLMAEASTTTSLS